MIHPSAPDPQYLRLIAEGERDRAHDRELDAEADLHFDGTAHGQHDAVERRFWEERREPSRTETRDSPALGENGPAPTSAAHAPSHNDAATSAGGTTSVTALLQTARDSLADAIDQIDGLERNLSHPSILRSSLNHLRWKIEMAGYDAIDRGY